VTEPALEIAFSAVLGLVVGSFLNVVIWRLPRGESIVRPGSHCPQCQRRLLPWENIPLLSYLVQRGRCRGCGARIALRYPAVEALTVCVFAVVAWRFGLSPAGLVYMAFAAALVAAAAIDLEHRIIPDSISVGGLLFGLLVVPALRMHAGFSFADALEFSFGGALFGSGAVWAVGFLHARVAVAMGRRFPHWPGEDEAYPKPLSLDYWIWFPGMGFGDVKLLAMIGAFLGPAGALETILAGAVLGLIVGVGYGLVRRGFDAPFGFGPSLAAAALLSLLSPVRLFSLWSG